MDSKEFISALTAVGATPVSYSGRGMYGLKCIGVSVSQESNMTAWSLAISIVEHLIESDDAADFSTRMPQEPEQDSLGLGYILYWPDMEWPDDVAEPEDEEELIEDLESFIDDEFAGLEYDEQSSVRQNYLNAINAATTDEQRHFLEEWFARWNNRVMN